jgi:hypothetical protein
LVFVLDPRKQAKMQWLQYPNHSNVDNLNNVQCEASRHFRNKKKEYMTAKIDEREPNSKTKKYRIGASVILRRVANLQLIYD